MTDWNVPRDNYGRPLLYPPEGGKRIAYTRPSTLAKDLDKINDGLIQYHQTNAVMGVAKTPQTLNRIKAIIAKGGNWEKNKGDFKEIVSKAAIIGDSLNKADRGTSIHDYCEVLETDPDNLDWSLVEEDLKGPLEGYWEDIASKPEMKFLAWEVTLAVNLPVTLPDGRKVTLRSAGSADRVVEIDGHRYMIDIKTGKDDLFRMGVSGQLALYVEGQMYRDDIIRPEIPWAEWYPNADDTADFAEHGSDYNEALMFHCPQQPTRGKWQWRILRVPLARGRDIIRCGQWARKLRYVPEFKEIRL